MKYECLGANLLKWCLAGLLLLSSLSVYSQRPYFKKISQSREIAATSINCMYQDRTGFMWFGTDKGLFKYNGINYQPFYLPDSTLKNAVTAVFQDHKDQIWVGYENGNLALVRNGALELFLPREGTPVVPITGIAEDSWGVLWFSTYGEGLYYYKDQRLFNLDEDDGLTGNDIYAIQVDHQGRVWAGTDAGLSICSLNGDKYRIKVLTTAQGLPDNIVRTLALGKEGEIWIGTYDRGVCKYQSKLDTVTIPPAWQDWQFGRLTSMQVDSDYIWLGTENQGILKYCFSKGRFEQYNAARGFSSAKILDLHVDHQQNLWIARNDNQIYWLQPSLNFIERLPGGIIHSITSIAHGRNGALWFSTAAGLFRYQPQSQDTLTRHLAGYDQVILPINSIFEDQQGSLWLGTWNGVFVYNPIDKKLKHYTEKDGLVNNNILSITGWGGDIWIATLGGVSHYQIPPAPKLFENFNNEALLGAGYIYKVFVDSKGRAWFATDGKGLILREHDRFTSFMDIQPQESRIIYSLTEDLQGNIWLSTPSNGIYKFDGTAFQGYSSEQGLRDLDIMGMAVDKQGKLVIVHSLGLDLLNPQTGEIMYFGEESGINGIEADINSITVDADKVVWIGTKEGIISFDPGHATMEMHPRTIIDQTAIFLKPAILGADSKLKYEQNHLSFDYVGLWYQNPQEVTYEYKLDGFDLNWNTTKSQTSTYPRLPPGDYTFQVRSSINNIFKAQDIASLSFTIDSPIWQKGWFLLVSGTIGAFLFIWVIRYRENRLRLAERLKKELIQTQLETLKSQVNPHFLFNSFNTLVGIIEEDKSLAVDYVEKLSDFFRAVLEYRDKQLITVGEELELIKNYYYLQKKRYGENLRIEISVDVDSREKYIPPLTLQMLVENTVKHNVASKDKPLFIKIYSENRYLFVSNNKQLKKYKQDSTGFGLFSIINRYKLLTKQPVKINHEDHHMYWVGVPLLKDTIL